MSLSSLTAPVRPRRAPSLHRRFIVSAGIAGALVVAALALGASLLLTRDIEQQGDARIADAASRAHLVISEALAERVREARVVSITPPVIAATLAGAARARSLSLVGADIKALETRFRAERSMQVASGTRDFLRALLPQLDAAEMLLTDANGYNSVITERSSDFVQSDEAWWQSAWRDGLSPADAAFDSSAHQTTVSIAALVKNGEAKSGVLKLAFSVAPLVRSLAAAGAGVRIDVLDSVDHVLIGSDSTVVGTRLRGMPAARDDITRPVTVAGESASERVAMLRTNTGRWRVVAHLPSREISAPLQKMRVLLVGAAVLLLAVLIALLTAMNGFLRRRISEPCTEIAELAEAVAAGNFSMEPKHSAANDEVGRLNRAVSAMVLELRRLATTIAGSARDTHAMSSEIGASTEEMAASASEIANTASDLSSQANSMASTISSLSRTSTSLRAVSKTLDDGARDGVVRNAALKALAEENRAGLDTSAAALATLEAEVSTSANAIETLGAASEEIREFVTLVRALARQSKLLSLNAAMEAARAGEQGKGFSVVATEVRRLSSMSSEAAERTGAIVKSVLAGIDRSREASERALVTANDVRSTTSRASASFAEIERAVAESEAWTAMIERASTETQSLVGEINQRVDELASGTETFAAAMQEVAASSQEQSASTEDIAGAASAMGAAAEELSRIVGAMKTS